MIFLAGDFFWARFFCWAIFFGRAIFLWRSQRCVSPPSADLLNFNYPYHSFSIRTYPLVQTSAPSGPAGIIPPPATPRACITCIVCIWYNNNATGGMYIFIYKYIKQKNFCFFVYIHKKIIIYGG